MQLCMPLLKVASQIVMLLCDCCTEELCDLLQSSGCEVFRFLLILSSVGAVREYQLQQCAQDDSRPRAASAHWCVPFGWLTKCGY